MCTSGTCPCPEPAPAAVSVADDSMDQMIQAASVPNLATLFAKAKASGAIGAVTVYGGAGT